MAIEKLKSGHYRVRFTINKKKYSITVDRKPTKREEAALVHEYSEEIKKADRGKKDGTFLDFANEYINSKEKVLSASTIRGYKATLRGIPDEFTSIPFYEIEQHDITKVVNSMIDKAKPKTIYNRHGLIVSVLKEFRPDFIVRTKLPRKEQKDIYTPSEKEVQALFMALKDTDEYIPICLATMGLRRSEIGALTLEDLSDDNVLTINKAKVQNSDEKWIIQNYTKTERSNRKVPIPDELANRIRKQGYFYSHVLGKVYEKMIKVENELGLPRFGIHRLRSYFASKAHALGLADSVIMTLGGWKSDNIMKNIYRKALNEDIKEGTKTYLDHIDSMSKKQDENGQGDHESDHKI